MNHSSVRRALAGLAVLTASFALAAPAQAAGRTLTAGATVQVPATPGQVYHAPMSVTNNTTAPVDGAAITTLLSGLRTAASYQNCVYDVTGEITGCRFDQTLQPGKTYLLDLPLRAPADAYAPSTATAWFEWLSGSEYDLLNSPWTPGTGETLRLTESATPGDGRPGSTLQRIETTFTGTNGADLVALGAKASGAAGEVVQAKVGVRNDGPATLDWITEGVSPALVVVTIPAGTSVATKPSQCTLESTGQYACKSSNRVKVGQTNTYTFGLRIDKVVQGATGAVEVNPPCECERFADDLNKSNDKAQIVVNPAPTAPGSPDTNPPVVSSTGLTDGQWLGRSTTVTPRWSDDVAVTKVQVLVDGVVTQTYTAPLPTEIWPAPPAQLHDKDVRVTVRAFDAAGNSSERSTPVRVDLLSPEPAITPAFGAAVRGVVTFRATKVAGDTTRSEVVDEATRKVVAKSTAAPWTMTWNTSGLNGQRSVTIRAFDRAGNARLLFGSFRVDNAGPAVRSITPGNRALVRGSVRTTVQASDPSGLKSARVTGGRATSSPLTWTVTPKAQGPYTVEWVLTDKLGNTTVARRVVVNDTVAPALKVVKAPKTGAKLTKSVQLTAAATDRNGVARVQLLVNGKVVATDAKAGYAFTLNPKKYGKKFTVALRAYDKAGNVKSSTTRTYRR